MEINFLDICRGCRAKTIGGLKMTKLFSKTNDIAAMFSSCSTLIIKPDDGLPKCLCTTCLATLMSAYEFQLQCINTDKELRLELGLLNNSEAAMIAEATTTTECISLTTPKSDDQKMPIQELKVEILLSELYQSNENNHFQPKLETVQKDSEAELMNEEDSESEVGEIAITQTTKPIVKNEDDLENDDHQYFYVDDSEIDENSDSEDDCPLKLPIPKRKRNRSVKESRLKKEHICEVCNKSFEKASRLLRHLNVHNADGKPFECEVCKIRFVSKRSLIRHGIKHSDTLFPSTLLINKTPSAYNCKFCPREFSKQESLSSHLRIHKDQLHEKKDFICEYCPKILPNQRALRRHVQTHDEAKIHKCNTCERVFSLRGQLVNHVMSKHKGVKPFVCSFCKKGKTSVFFIRTLS